MVLTESKYFDHLTVFRNKKYITFRLRMPILSIPHQLIFLETVIFVRATFYLEHFTITRRTAWIQVPTAIYSSSLRLFDSVNMISINKINYCMQYDAQYFFIEWFFILQTFSMKYLIVIEAISHTLKMQALLVVISSPFILVAEINFFENLK